MADFHKRQRKILLSVNVLTFNHTLLLASVFYFKIILIFFMTVLDAGESYQENKMNIKHFLLFKQSIMLEAKYSKNINYGLPLIMP